MAPLLKTHAANDSQFRALEDATGAKWKHIHRAAALATERLADVEKALNDDNGPIATTDTSVVLFGSLARAEFTEGSDLDWSLLIDAHADAEHLQTAQEIERRFTERGFQKPGPTATFGAMAFSHSLIHDIGGQADSNINTTRRMLLLLESVPAGRPEAYERVVRGVINRYLENDQSSITSTKDEPVKVPRFLLNDLVRFWRTLAVDYASKYRERGGDKWATRNLKIRLSRKLIFASGLIMVFDGINQLSPKEAKNLFGKELHWQPLSEKLFEMVNTTPIELLADQLLRVKRPDLGKTIFDAYDGFLGALSDADQRIHLDQLSASNASTDDTFKKVRAMGHAFDKALQELFYDTPAFAKLTRNYSLF